jgi:uncharacterized SAM-binding protein YcdF (DUF218 family)
MPRPARWLLWSIGAVVAGGVMDWAVIFVTVWRASTADSRRPSDAIIVLGAAQYNGRPSDVYAARLDHAAELYRAGVAPAVLTIGGGQEGDRLTEGEAGRQYLAAAGLPAVALTAVGTGNDTLLSMRAADEVLDQRGWTSVVLVTDPWHSERSQLIASDLGLSVQVSPVTQGPSTESGVAGRYVLRETLGTLFYLLTGGSSGAGSAVL